MTDLDLYTFYNEDIEKAIILKYYCKGNIDKYTIEDIPFLELDTNVLHTAKNLTVIESKFAQQFVIDANNSTKCSFLHENIKKEYWKYFDVKKFLKEHNRWFYTPFDYFTILDTIKFDNPNSRCKESYYIVQKEDLEKESRYEEDEKEYINNLNLYNNDEIF